MKNLARIITLSSTLVFTSLTSISAFAVDGLSANIGATNNYLWRGVTQTNNNAAISGGIDYADKSGFYAGIWTSNASWAENMTYEADLYGGFTGDLGNGFSYDAGYIYYNYDAAANSDFSEVYVNLSYGAFSIGYNTLVDSDAGGNFGDDTYITSDATFNIAKDLNLAFHLGHYNFNAGGDYTDYGVSLSKAGFTLTLTDTDINGADGDVNVVVAYSVDFDL
jgi:uncharacterized protein (TIGR02001 family)